MNPSAIAELMQWAYAYGEPTCRARMRTQPEDFVVDEILGFEPSGEGQHRMLLLRKRNTNTDWLARQLARFAGVEPRDVGYAGLKDRNAVTTQWYSVDLAGKAEPDWSAFDSDEYQVLQVVAHNKKLRKGILQGNRFLLTLREFEGERPQLEQRLQAIARDGVPNYFGEQRFGHGGDNILQAWKMLNREIRVKDRNRKGIYLSAARSLLFNAVLSQRVKDGSWNRILTGEAAMLAGSQSFFTVESVDAAIEQRCRDWDIHPSGPMWGRGRSAVSGEATAIEQAVLDGLAQWLSPLEHAGLKQERRPLRLQVAELQWEWLGEDSLQIGFRLPAGSYATSVLRELIQVKPQA
jgi:tRNA pseudouridine13 synthase